jgi:hypothetical protein
MVGPSATAIPDMMPNQENARVHVDKEFRVQLRTLNRDATSGFRHR